MLAGAHRDPRSNDTLPVCLWKENPNRLVSLADIVKIFFPWIFTGLYKMAVLFTEFSGETVLTPSPLKEGTLETVSKQRPYCAELGLVASLATIDRIIGVLSNSDCTMAQLSELGKELQGRLDDELAGALFFSIDPSEIEYYRNPTRDWEQVVKAWPKTQIDIEESSRCYALSRYAAAIFHALLIAELGVIEVAKLVNAAGDKPGWGALDRLERIIKRPYNERTLLEQTHSELLTQMLPQIGRASCR